MKMSQNAVPHESAQFLPVSQNDVRVLKRPSHALSSVPPKKVSYSGCNNLTADGNTLLPPCLKKLVRSVVRTFYSREHSLIVDMLVRNTIMKEDDLCDRLRFEKKQLRQYLHTLKTDQFIKYKLQLETDADGKTSKIVHYFIEYQLFVNVVKYRLDQMQRRLEAEQRQSGNRATFRCLVCNITYTDLEVDRLLSADHPGRLECVYCRAEVTEQQEPQHQSSEDHRSRSDGRARIANFHRQVRDPIDAMLRECDAVHLSSSLLEPEIRPLDPLEDDTVIAPSTLGVTPKPSKDSVLDTGQISSTNSDSSTAALSSSITESRIRIVLSDQLESTQLLKPRPVWMADSTIYAGPGLGCEANSASTTNITAPPSSDTPTTTDCLTHTLTPGRIPTNFPTPSPNAAGSRDSLVDSSHTGSGGSSGSVGDIMQLLLVHERRGLGSTHLAAKNPQSTASRSTHKQSLPSTAHIGSQVTQEPSEKSEVDRCKFLVPIGERRVPYSEITPAEIKRMTAQERAEYVRIGKLVYQNIMLV